MSERDHAERAAMQLGGALNGKQSSFKGFLAKVSGDGHVQVRRMSQVQKDKVLQAVDLAMLSAVDGGLRPERHAEIMEVVRWAVDRYPADRSCYTCSYEARGRCSRWRSDIPNLKHADAGCEEHDALPF